MMIYWAKAAFLLLLVSAGPLTAQTYPADTDPYVVDYANLLSTSEETGLRNTLLELRDARGIEFVVVTINQMSQYGHSGGVEPFATGLFNEWGIGDATRNDGLLLLVSHADRELRIEVGAGYGDTLDGPMQRVINKTIVPYFRDNNYPKGIEAGVDEIIYQVTDRYPGEYESSDLAARWNAVVRTVSWIVGPWMLFLLIPAAPIGWRFYRRWQRNHARKCPNDGHRMRRYLEETEDVALNKGQQMEERLKSIDHDVWYCDTCEHITIESYPTKQKTYGACSKCNHRTMEGRSLVTVMPSAVKAGSRDITWTCHNCNHIQRETKSIAATGHRDNNTRSSSRSSSSRSSSRRGGGRSRGGGASGKW